jgi:hypothetical protein
LANLRCKFEGTKGFRKNGSNRYKTIQPALISSPNWAIALTSSSSSTIKIDLEPIREADFSCPKGTKNQLL